MGRERTYICQSATTRVLHNSNSKLANENLANGLNVLAKHALEQPESLKEVVGI